MSIDKELSLNSTIPSSTKKFSSSDPENTLIIPGFKKDIIEMWSFKIPISPSKAGITTTNKGSITSVQAIYVPADDLTDPAPATSFSHLDATTVLSRQIAELGIYPQLTL